MKNKLNVGLDFAAPIPLHTDYSSDKFEGFEVDLMKYFQSAVVAGRRNAIFLPAPSPKTLCITLLTIQNF